MQYEVAQDRVHNEDYRVEAIDHESEGECYIAIFSGPLAKARADEYAAWKNVSEQVSRRQRREAVCA